MPKPVNPLTGAQEFNGTSIIDVTDPHQPKYVAHLPGDAGNYEDGGAQMVRVCDGKSLPKGDPSAVYMLRTFGNSAHEIWNTADPANPKLITRLDGLKGTHKNWWECDTGIAYLVSGIAGWRVNRMTEIYDLSDPAQAGEDPRLRSARPAAGRRRPRPRPGCTAPSRPAPRATASISPTAPMKAACCRSSTARSCSADPKEPTPGEPAAPQIGRLDMSPLPARTQRFPVLEMPIAEFAKDKLGKVRNFVVVTNEQILNECLETAPVRLVRRRDRGARPGVGLDLGVPEATGEFCSRGGRFGTHASNESMTPIYYGRLMFFSHFNAGVRAVDIRDPYHPKEVAYYIPAITKNTDKRCIKLDDGQERCKMAIQTNNVEVDDRGYIYAVDRANTGLHILELNGAARQIANFPK